MKRSSSRKLKSVSWAPGSNLSQVKLFVSEDCPSKVDKKTQDHFQAKTLSIRPSTTNEYDDNLPPGFEGNHFQNQSKAELPHIPQIKWECPPLFTLSSHWHVTAGEESREKHHQKLREMRELEAVYPRVSAIPPSPYVSSEVEKQYYVDSLTPPVTLIPIEEEEESVEDIQPDAAVTKHADSPTKKSQSQNLQQDIPSETSLVNSQCSGEPKPVAVTYSEADLAAAFAVVAAAIMKSDEIDMDLLVRILKDPIMIDKLIEQHRTATTTASYSKHSTSSVPLFSPPPSTTVGLLPASGPSLATSSVPLLTPTLVKSATTIATPPASVHSVTRSVDKRISSSNNHSPPQGMKRETPLTSVSSRPSASGNIHAVAKQVRSTTAGAEKDVNPYKNLDRKHATHDHDMQRHNNFQDWKRPRNNIMKSGEVKFKIQRQCKYFKSSRGCHDGLNCRYQHDMAASNIPMTRNAKRLKVGSETAWRM